MRLLAPAAVNRLVSALLFAGAGATYTAVRFGLPLRGEFFDVLIVLSALLAGAIAGPRIARSAVVTVPRVKWRWLADGIVAGMAVMSLGYLIGTCVFGGMAAVMGSVHEGATMIGLALTFGLVLVLAPALPFGAAAGVAVFAFHRLLRRSAA